MAKLKTKKTIYKKWWFWVVIIVFGIGALGASGNDNDKSDDIPVLEAIAETPSRTFETPDEKGWRLSDEAAAEDVRNQQAIAALEEIPSENVQDIATPQPQKQPTQEVSHDEPEPAQKSVEAEPEPKPPKELVKISATVSGTSRTISLDSGSLVWLSATGKKFHSINNCGKMVPENAHQVTIDYASEHGFNACEKCW